MFAHKTTPVCPLGLAKSPAYGRHSRNVRLKPSLLVCELLKNEADGLSLFGSNLVDRNGYPISIC